MKANLAVVIRIKLIIITLSVGKRQIYRQPIEKPLDDEAQV